jgi:hypothetical protein
LSFIKQGQKRFENINMIWKKIKSREKRQYCQIYRTKKLLTTCILLIFININPSHSLPIVHHPNSKFVNVNSGKKKFQQF